MKVKKIFKPFHFTQQSQKQLIKPAKDQNNYSSVFVHTLFTTLRYEHGLFVFSLTDREETPI